MLIEHFHNASCIVTSHSGTRILCDPWFTDGAFVGSWCLAQPVHRIPEQGKDFDLVYLSHVHPDHFDEAFLSGLDRSIQLVVPKEPVMPILVPKLTQMGFTNLSALADREQLQVDDLTLTIFEPFQKNPYDSAATLPNFLDSALLIDDGHHSFLNTNDNFPTPESLRSIEDEFGIPDLITLLYNSAGFYPQCVTDLDHDEKLEQRELVLSKAIDRCANLAAASRSPMVTPFAGDYALGGRLSSLNQYLPVSTPDIAAQRLRDRGHAAVAIGTGGVYSLADQAIIVEGKHYTEQEAAKRAAEVDLEYPYDLDPEVDPSALADQLVTAAASMRARQAKVGVFPKYFVEFVDLNGDAIGTVDVSDGDACHRVTCTLDSRLLSGILSRRYHWDNAQIGCHLSFSRSNHPAYSSDLHFILSLLHV